MEEHKQRCWSDLQIDILASIIELLEARIDIIRVGSVCHSWRNSVAYCHSSDLQGSLEKYCFGRIKFPKCLNFYLTITYMVKPICQDYNSFLIEVDHHHSSPSQHKARLLHLITPRNKTGIIFYSKEVIDSRNYHVSEMCIKHTLKYIPDPSLFKKLIVYPDNYWTKREDCMVLAINRCGNLIYCKLGDWNWKKMNTNSESNFKDIIVCNGKLYAVDWRRLWVIGFPSSDYVMNFVCELIPGSKNLVESCGDLYLISAAFHQENQIYKLRDCKYWELVQGINDRIFFTRAGLKEMHRSSFIWKSESLAVLLILNHAQI
ncbi:F-box protein At2g17036-like [Mercurialis annua]|uniref:F-box protein At2g17036-like n=1 Tax=Mercurialis annua TaxID=3986 RepID=UPI00215FF0EB|nr:F-box protein At2g17036-like [Mercurialis annua]